MSRKVGTGFPTKDMRQQTRSTIALLQRVVVRLADRLLALLETGEPVRDLRQRAVTPQRRHHVVDRLQRRLQRRIGIEHAAEAKRRQFVA